MTAYTSGDVTVRIIERDSRRVPLGIRLWDPVLNAAVTENLQILATPLAGRPASRRSVVAQRTPSGIYAFHSLPGLASYERLVAETQPSPPLPERLRYRVSVFDAAHDYLPIAFEVELPLDDLGPLIGAQVASPDAYVPGVLLFAAPTRRIPPWLAAVRGTLQRADTEGPAAHAAVVLTDPDGTRWRGIADAEGRFTIALGYPKPAATTEGSPPRVAVGPLPRQTWTVTLEVHHDAALAPMAEVGLPDYRDILAQFDRPPAGIAQNETSPQTFGTDWQGLLRHGTDLVARTGRLDELLIGET